MLIWAKLIALMSNNLDISNFLNDVFDDWQRSRDSFPKNIVSGEYWPIPFFGNPATARVATIGANPSSEEFKPNRKWPKVTKANRGAWKSRLKNYFNHSLAPDDWFDPWTVGLALLDCSYKEGTAAHFDVSYRPTTAMLTNKNTDPKEFHAMVVQDVQWIFKILPLCPNLRLLLTMGPIIGGNLKPTPLIGFLGEAAPRHGYRMIRQEPFWEFWHEESRRVFVIHEADTTGEKCITCRVVKHIHAHRDELRQRLI
jgi:hypothetical protein